MKILKEETVKGVKYWVVMNERGYSARYGDVYLENKNLSCRCIQFQRYDHCTHCDFIAKQPYKKGQTI